MPEDEFNCHRNLSDCRYLTYLAEMVSPNLCNIQIMQVVVLITATIGIKTLIYFSIDYSLDTLEVNKIYLLKIITIRDMNFVLLF